MLTCSEQDCWKQFLEYIQQKCSATEFQNWFAQIKPIKILEDKIVLQVPNIFVEQYLLDNFKEDLLLFVPRLANGDPAVEFVINEPEVTKIPSPLALPQENAISHELAQFNPHYTFENFIEGPSNQFVKSAAFGVASKPGKTFNPLFIHGGVGLGKTHLLHGIGHYFHTHHKKLKVLCITTEMFINNLVNHLREKTIDQMKRQYRSLDLLLVDDIQFLQNRMNFEEEFCNTFESLIHQNKQIVITSDKPPSQLKLSERIIARMEWGLVAHMGVPELETRVAIIQHKAQQKGFSIPNNVAFFIADHIYHNVRQLEGAINRLNAYCRLMRIDITEEIAENLLREMFEYAPQNKISVEGIIKGVSSVFEIKFSDLKGDSRKKNIAFARQVAMYLAKETVTDSLENLGKSFGGKSHSTLIHAWNKISKDLETNSTLKRQIQMVRRHLES